MSSSTAEDRITTDGGKPPRILSTTTTSATTTQPSVSSSTSPLSVTGQPIKLNDNLAAAVSSAMSAAGASRSLESSPYPSPKGDNNGAGCGGGTDDLVITKPLLSRQNSDASTTITVASSSGTDGGDLPNNVSTEAQLVGLPDVCLSTKSKNRPLRHVDEQGRVSTYALQPMFYSVIFILLVELLERFSFYGVEYTQTSFLTGAYNPDWNAGMSAVSASSFVSISTAVAYTMPFVGAILADSVLGDYWSILFGNIFFYIPGLLLITLSTVPHLLGDTFNKKALSFGLLVMWPCGTGIVKSIVNVFGAKQVCVCVL
jgi:hypothetical protein